MLCNLQACLEEDEDRVAEHSSKRTARVLEARSLVLPGAQSSSAPDDDAAADATYTVNEAIDYMGDHDVQLS